MADENLGNEAKPAASTPPEKATPHELESVLPDQILDKLDPGDRQVIKESFLTMMRVSGPMPHPLLSKFTQEHIDKILDGIDREKQRDHAAADADRKYNFWIYLTALAALVAIIILLKEQKDLLIPLLSLITGFAGGFGFGKWKK